MREAAFTVRVADVGDELLVTCDGEMDMATVERFRVAMEEVLAKHPERVHLDCGGVEFIDSIGIKALMHAATECAANDIPMTVTASLQMRRLFDTIGVTPLFSLTP